MQNMNQPSIKNRNLQNMQMSNMQNMSMPEIKPSAQTILNQIKNEFNSCI